MEMEFRDDRRRGRIVMGLGLVLALVAGAGAYVAVNSAQEAGSAANVRRVPAVVAVSVIPARQAITADQVELREVPLDDTNLNGVTTDVNDVVGRVPVVSILQGQLVTSNMLASSSEGVGFSILGPNETVAPDSPHWRAVSLTVPDDLAVGGMLAPGNTVDIFVTAVITVPEELVASGDYVSDRSTKITYQNVLILARRDAFYVIRASLPVAEEILHLQATGTSTFSMVLRPDVDQRLADATTLGETTNRIIETYGLPLPEPLERVRPLPRPTATPLATPPPASPEASASPAP
jgi:Flp pilus assembly protein CpaB